MSLLAKIEELNSKITQIVSEEEEDDDDGLDDNSRRRSRRSRKRLRVSRTAPPKDAEQERRKVHALQLKLKEMEILHERDNKKFKIRERALKEANEKKIEKMRVLMKEIADLRQKILRQERKVSETETSSIKRVADLDKIIVDLREKVSEANVAASQATTEVHTLRQNLERIKFESAQKIAKLEFQLDEAGHETDDAVIPSAESKVIVDRLRRDLDEMTRRAEDAESRLLNSRPSRALAEKHAMRVSSMERVERSLMKKVEYLEKSQSENQIATVRLASTEASIDRLRTANDALLKDLAELPELRRKCKEWETVMGDVLRRSTINRSGRYESNATPTPALVAAQMVSLNDKIALLLQSRGDAEISEASARRAKIDAEQDLTTLRADLGDRGKKLDEALSTIRDLEFSKLTLEKDVQSLESLVQFYQKAQGTRVDDNDEREILRKRVETLESALADSRVRVEDLRKRSKTASLSDRQYTKSGAHGDETCAAPRKTKILHLTLNPAAKAHKEHAEKERAELLALRKEIVRLRSLMSSSGGTSASFVKTPMSALSTAAPSKSSLKDGGDLQTRYERLKEVFRARMQRFREAVYLLTGFKVDMENTSNDPHLRLRSMYATSEKDFLLFRWKKDGMDLCESDAVSEFRDAMGLYLQKMNSIPAFLAGVTLQLFEQTTVAMSS